MAYYGYSGQILRVDLSTGGAAPVPTSDYADRFLGGRGIAAKIYWDEVPPGTDAFDPENRLIFATGPLCGLPMVGGSRWEVCGKSPISPGHFGFSNLGGTWGAELKFAGYDAIIVEGKSDKPVYLFLHDDLAELKDGSSLWGKGAAETREILKEELGSSVKVVAIGPAGENLAIMASLLADKDSSGSGGLGAVMGSKKLKAIVVRGSKKGVKAAQPEKFRQLVRDSRLGQNYTSVHYGSEWMATGARTKRDPCYGCAGCIRASYETEDGRKGKFMCTSGHFYRPWAEKYYGGWTDVPFLANRFCDEYGVDAHAMLLITYWLQRCRRAGLIDDEKSGIPLSKLGSLEFIEALIRNISLRYGFGDVLAQGVLRAADWVGPEAREILDSYLFWNGYDEEVYGPRLYTTMGLLYAMEPRRTIYQLHEVTFPVAKWLNWVKGIEGEYVSTSVLRGIAKRFWGSEQAADFSTYEGKALAVKCIQDREYAKECLILCDFLWPITEVRHTEDHVGDPSLESKVLSTVISKQVTEDDLYRIGERVLNLQRAILVREGHKGREFDMLPDTWYSRPLQHDYMNPELLVPGKGGEVISRKGAVVDRDEFERMKDEYYALRQWEIATGLQTKAKLESLGLGDIAAGMEQKGLLADTEPTDTHLHQPSSQLQRRHV